MKKLLFFVLLLAAIACQAQNKPVGRWYDYARDSYFGVRVGVSASQIFLNGSNMSNAGTTSRAGWDVMVVAGHQLGNGVPLFIEGGLRFVQKQVQVEWKKDEYKIDQSYIELPVVFKYKIATGVDDFSVQPFFGGFFAVGVGGATRVYPKREQKFDTFSTDLLRRIDGGLRLGCGIAYQNFYVDMSYDVGLANVARSDCRYFDYDSFDNKIRTGCFSLCIGLDF